jgi:thiosulfate dehydrogenase [quinone] large subunit
MSGHDSGTSSAAALAALLLVQICLGYEWLVSGLTKLVHGDFPHGLAAALGEMSKASPGWYRDFLASIVVPHAAAFGYAIEIAEVAVGGVLLVAAAVWLAGDGRMPAPWLRAWRLASGAAAVVGLALVVSFELANGGTFGLRLASDSFDEGLDLDTLMIGLQLAVLVWSAAALPRGARLPVWSRRSTVSRPA